MTNKKIDKKTTFPHFIAFLLILIGLLMIGPIYLVLPNNTDFIQFITIGIAFSIVFFILFRLHQTFQPKVIRVEPDHALKEDLATTECNEPIHYQNDIKNKVVQHQLEPKKSIQKLSKSQVNRIFRIRHKLAKELPQESQNALDGIIDLFNYFNNEAYTKLGNNVKLIKKMQKIQQKTFRDIKTITDKYRKYHLDEQQQFQSKLEKSLDEWINHEMYLINDDVFKSYQFIFIQEINQFIDHQNHIHQRIQYDEYFKIKKS